MNIYALSSLLASYVFFILGIFIYQRDTRNQLNRIYMAGCLLLGYLAFAEFGLRQSADIAAAYTWFRIGSVWPFSIAVYMHFILVFTKKKRILQKKVTYFLLYVPALIFALLELTTDSITGEPVKEYWGWTYSIPEDPFVFNINAVWFTFLTILPIILVFMYFRRAENNIEKRRAKFVFVGLLLPAVAGLATEGSFPATDVRVPEFTIIASAFEVIIIAYGIYRYNIFALTPAVAADDIVSAMSNVLFLVQEDGSISLANQSALTLLHYGETQLMGQQLKSVFAEGEWEKVQKLSNVGSDINQETTFVTKDGEKIPVLVSISTIQDKDGNNLGVLCIGSDLTDHKLAEEAWRKEVLLKEIHHRVKNNMQIISSLLRLQSQYIADKEYREMFRESQNRIRSMALIHEKLYQSETLENINFRNYITDMVRGLVLSYSDQDIALEIEADNLLLGVDTAVPCGLIINELITNALKHAFPDKRGKIGVGFHGSDGTIELVVKDDGVGIPDSIDFRNVKTLGLRLVTILAEDQLDGEITLMRDKGTEFHITFESK